MRVCVRVCVCAIVCVSSRTRGGQEENCGTDRLFLLQIILLMSLYYDNPVAGFLLAEGLIMKPKLLRGAEHFHVPEGTHGSGISELLAYNFC